MKQNPFIRKTIQIFAILLQFLAVILYIGTIRAGIAWFNEDVEMGTFTLFIVLAIIVQTISTTLRNRYPDLVDNAEDVMYTSKELQDKKDGVEKNPIIIKILLVIPTTFALAVILLGLYTLYLSLTGKL